MSSAFATVADAWDDFAQLLPVDMPDAEVTRLRRAFYAGALDAVRTIADGVKAEAIRAECIGFGRTLGRPVETAR